MSFNSNVNPKKRPPKPVGSPWQCGCNVQQPRYVLYCPRCEKGQAKP
jgi:hypothetical protein